MLYDCMCWKVVGWNNLKDLFRRRLMICKIFVSVYFYVLIFIDLNSDKYEDYIIKLRKVYYLDDLWRKFMIWVWLLEFAVEFIDFWILYVYYSIYIFGSIYIYV